jgi:hypothetical protein
MGKLLHHDGSGDGVLRELRRLGDVAAGAREILRGHHHLGEAKGAHGVPEVVGSGKGARGHQADRRALHHLRLQLDEGEKVLIRANRRSAAQLL